MRLLVYGGDRAVARLPFRQPQPILPTHQAARLQKPAGAQCRLADQQARAEADRAGEFVRFTGDCRPQFKFDSADFDAVAGVQSEPRQKQRVCRGAECAVVLGQQRRKRQWRIGRERAEQRIAIVDGFDLDQRGHKPGCICRESHWTRHRAQASGHGHRAMRIEESAFGVVGLALNERKCKVAAEDHATGFADAFS